MDPVAALRQIAFYKDRAREDTRRVMAYRNAADIVEGLDDTTRERHGQANSWQSLPGIGPKTAKVIAQAWSGREPDALVELRAAAEDRERPVVGDLVGRRPLVAAEARRHCLSEQLGGSPANACLEKADSQPVLFGRGFAGRQIVRHIGVNEANLSAGGGVLGCRGGRRRPAAG